MCSPTGSSSVPEEPRDSDQASGPSRPDDLGPADGASLLADRALLDQGEAAWLAKLARFDASGDWALDGMASCAVWLVANAKMGRSTAHDKVRTARQLARRPLVAAAFSEGRITYSAVRTITRVTDLDPDTDQALINLAVAGTVADLERTVRHIELLADQDRPPPDNRTGLRAQRVGGGISRLIIDAPDIDIDEILTTIEAALVARNHRDDQAARPSAEDTTDQPEDESSAEDTCRHRWGPAARADVFLDLLRLAADTNPDTSGGGDRYLTHVIVRPDGTTT